MLKYTEPKLKRNSLQARILHDQCSMTVYARKVAQLIMKNLLFADKTLSEAWLLELQPDWSKQKIWFQVYVRDHKV